MLADHPPGPPFALDHQSVIMAQEDDALAGLVPLIPADKLMPLTGVMVLGARKRWSSRAYAEASAARLKLARLRIDRTLSD